MDAVFTIADSDEITRTADGNSMSAAEISVIANTASTIADGNSTDAKTASTGGETSEGVTRGEILRDEASAMATLTAEEAPTRVIFVGKADLGVEATEVAAALAVGVTAGEATPVAERAHAAADTGKPSSQRKNFNRPAAPSCRPVTF